MSATKYHFFSPSRTILFSMAAAIIFGTFLLSFPFARTQDIPLIDLFFTATSCTCVTGLMSIPFEQFTIFGHLIMLILIQIGGLGLITLTFFIISLFINVDLSTQVMAGQMLDLHSWKDIKKTILFITGISFFIEIVGAFFIFQNIKHDYNFLKAIFYSFFHAISSFCNAGFTPFKNGMIAYCQNQNMIIITSILMICGGIGFITWRDLYAFFKSFKKTKRHQLTLQTKIIISYYLFFAIAGTFLFWVLEHHNTLESFNIPFQWLNAFFTSISSRSGGCMSLHPEDLQNASLFILMISGFIGSAPGSTGSGIKLTTTAIFIGIIHAAIKGKTVVNIDKRAIAKDQVYKALAIVALAIMWIVITTFCLLITENSWPFLDILFESVSAFTTLGVSIGVTPFLSIIGKILIAFSMFVGRIGSLTLLIALQTKQASQDYSYPEERVMIS